MGNNERIATIPIKTKDGGEAYIKGIFTKSGKFVVVNERTLIMYLMLVFIFLLIVLLFIYDGLANNQKALGRFIYESFNQSIVSGKIGPTYQI